MGDETFEKIKNESFYAAPPYAYRPSVAEYLTTMHISVRGVIADFMHLDKKGKINIDKFESDGIVVTAKDNSDLTDTELFLWDVVLRRIRADTNAYEHAYPADILIKETMNGGATSNAPKACKITFNEMRQFLPVYERKVLQNIEGKFGSGFKIMPKGIIGMATFGFMVNFCMSIVASFVNTILSVFMFIFVAAFLANNSALGTVVMAGSYLLSLLLVPAIFFLLGYRKLKKFPLEWKYLAREILFSLLKLELLMLLVYGVAIGIVGAGLYMVAIASQNSSIFILILVGCMIGYVLLYGFYCYRFGVIAQRFFFWLSENQLTSENRQEWLKFKDFIFENSALADKPLKYYELWDEFYYYALAVGAIKKFE